jgi:hypothetical protein
VTQVEPLDHLVEELKRKTARRQANYVQQNIERAEFFKQDVR